MPGLIRTNTSGFTNVSFSKATKKWEAHIRINGKRRYLGLHESAEAAHAAFLKAKAALPPGPPPEEVKATKLVELLSKVRELYLQHGLEALSAPFLERHGLHLPLWKLGVTHPILLVEFGVTEEYKVWRQQHRSYRGTVKPTWTWEQAIKVADSVAQQHSGDLPTLDWFRKNGYSALGSAIFKTGHSFEELRTAVGSFTTSCYRESRSGLRWRSQPECCLSDFLYARGVRHKRGERYDASNPEHAGHNRYDLHFVDRTGAWIDVEIWGGLEELSRGRYTETRAKKEAWRKGDLRFLGIESTDCLVEKRLAEILEAFIGRIEPFVFDKATDKLIETAHWSSSDELIETCRQLAELQPGRLFPNEQWLRKRGRYADRPGETYNTLAIRINQWLGGIRNVRKILGQAHASTTVWSRESLIAAWRAFEASHGISPAMASARKGYEHLPLAVLREGSRIYEGTRRYGVLNEAREGKTSRRIKWTPENVTAAWNNFVSAHGRTPTQCMSTARRKTLPKEVVCEATQIYGAARNLKLVGQLRARTVV